MSPSQALKRLKEIKKISKGDQESAHIDADLVLCDLLTSIGYEEIVEAFNEIDKWYA